ncbi:MAG: CPBP family intramembrane glutamic endopeptidase, partial [Alphaproteobacteria bacterium]
GPDGAEPAEAEVSVLPWWGGVAFALYGGGAEELMFRFGLVSGIAWVIAQLRRLVHSWEAAPNEAMEAWGGIVIAAIVFGLAHAGMGPGGLLVQASFRIAAGLLFGWLYWRQGIEAAITAHLAYDLVVFYAVVAVV